MEQVHILMIEGGPVRAYANKDRAEEDARLCGKMAAVEPDVEIKSIEFVGGRKKAEKK